MQRIFHQSIKRSGRMRSPAALLVIAALMIAIIGCNRSYYRRQADEDASRLVAEKSNNHLWDYGELSIETNPYSRLNDPFSADHPPLPPDDPASHEFMVQVDGKPGYPRWNANGVTDIVENPDWRAFLPCGPDGVLVLDMEAAYRLALLHSRDYQRQKEELYLAAIAVSLERFSFETQFFSPLGGSLSTTGSDRAGGATTTGTLNSGTAGTRLEKAGIAGSQLVINLANSLVWQLSGPDTNGWNTTLGFELVQPLLRGAGRDRILASLTDAERDLLANVRQMERFRRAFYLQITVGSGNGVEVTRSGGFLTAQSNTSFNAGGLLGLLQTQQDIRIQEANVAARRNILALFEEFAAANRLSQLQLQQFRSSLYDSQTSLIQAKADYQTSLDAYKIQLGLPPETEIRIEDPQLDKFILIGDDILQRQNDLYKLQESTGDIIIPFIQDDDYIDAEIIEDSDYAWSEELELGIKQLQEMLVETDKIQRQLLEVDFPQSQADIALFELQKEQRTEALKNLQGNIDKLYEANRSDLPVIEPEIIDEASLTETSETLEASVNALEKVTRELTEAFENQKTLLEEVLVEGPELKGADLHKVLKEKAFDAFPKLLTQMSGIVSEISLLQARARNDSLLLEDVSISSEQATEIAKVFRRDWMNARADLVDTWRNIEFVADNLESQFDLTFSGDVKNVGDNPLDFRLGAGRAAVGFQFDAPITRLSERNDYRTALINYQRARRSYMLFRDRVSENLRLIVRSIDISKLNFELRRELVKVAAKQLELAQFELIAPPRPGEAGSRLGSTTARDLVSAFDGLQSTQSALIRLYVNYEVLRRNLDFQMGTMQLDEEGFWIDPGKISAERGLALVPPYCESPVMYEEAFDGTDGFDEREEFQQRKPGELPESIDIPEIPEIREMLEKDVQPGVDGNTIDGAMSFPGLNTRPRTFGVAPARFQPSDHGETKSSRDFTREAELDQAYQQRLNWYRVLKQATADARSDESMPGESMPDDAK